MNYVLAGRTIGQVLGRSGGTASAVPWWLAGGVDAANAWAVYQPIGAASLADSYVNLANPGTYDAAPGVAPTFAAETGWTFAAARSQYLTTGIVPPDSTWTYICRFSDCTSGQAFGFYASSSVATVFPNAGGYRYYYHPSERRISGGVLAGVIGMAAQQGYLNGAADGAATTGQFLGNTTNQVRIRHANVVYLTGNIQAFALYNTTLSAAQMAAISSAMAAL